MKGQILTLFLGALWYSSALSASSLYTYQFAVNGASTNPYAQAGLLGGPLTDGEILATMSINVPDIPGSDPNYVNLSLSSDSLNPNFATIDNLIFHGWNYVPRNQGYPPTLKHDEIASFVQGTPSYYTGTVIDDMHPGAPEGIDSGYLLFNNALLPHAGFTADNPSRPLVEYDFRFYFSSSAGNDVIDFFSGPNVSNSDIYGDP